MSVTIVNDYKLSADGDKKASMAAAADLVKEFRADPAVQLSLWLEDRDDPLHHFHITVFDDVSAVERWKRSAVMERFVERYYPHMDRSTHVAPACDVWLAAGSGVKAVDVPS